MLIFGNYLKYNNIVKDLIFERKSNRENIFINWPGLLKFNVGDIIIVFFWIKGLFFRFEGICIAIRKKKFKKLDVSLILRNVLSSIGVELTIAYFHNRLFSLKFSDFKRKKFIYKRAQLYYLRNKLNSKSKI